MLNKDRRMTLPRSDLQSPFGRAGGISNGLDGGGSFLKQSFVAAISAYPQEFRHGFEWCAGLGEIGLSLLDFGLIQRLTLADINPYAVKASCQLSTDPRVARFVSDNLADVERPAGGFDLVVANPPNYFAVQFPEMNGDLRPNDPGWRVHAGFYDQVSSFLSEDAVLMISEVEPWKTAVEIDGAVYDRRPEAPITSFSRMWDDAGLVLETARPYYREAGADVWLLVLKNACP